jgi:dTDP-4-dehydrorhamnose reductase
MHAEAVAGGVRQRIDEAACAASSITVRSPWRAMPMRTRALTLEIVAAKAARPRFCAMSPARLAQFGIVMPSWQDAVERYIRDDLESSGATSRHT